MLLVSQFKGPNVPVTSITQCLTVVIAMNIANILINTIIQQMRDHFELPHLHKGVRFY